jgi:hypothetical protein
MKRCLVLLAGALLVSVLGFGQRVNYGIKAGFNSSMYRVSNFVINDITIDEVQNEYRVGYGASLFSRVNLGNHFIQLETSYNISLCEIVFDKLGGLHPDIEPDYASISSRIHSIGFPLLYGYNIVKTGPYGMSVFAGPQLRYIWNKQNEITFDNFDQEGINEVLHPFNLSLLAGVAVTVSPIFFDFRYEQCLNNISRSVTYTSIESSGGSWERTNMIFLPRKDHVLSFSLGIMF